MENTSYISKSSNNLKVKKNINTDSSKVIKIVVIDDNFSIREVIKSRLERIEDNLKVNFKIYSSSNGVEGLGFVYTVNPDIIVIDSTLPKYSGREVVEFIHHNDNLKDKKVIIVDGAVVSEDIYPDSFSVLNKKDKNFLDNLEQEIKDLEQIGVKTKLKTKKGNFQSTIERSVIKWSTISDDYLSKKSTVNFLLRFFMVFPWIIIQLIESFYYTLFRFFEHQIPEESIEQKQKDILMYRVKVYPTLITFFVGLFTLLFQFLIFLGGGIIIFNTRIDPVLALQSGEIGIEFNENNSSNFQYDNTQILITESGIKLKEIVREIQTEEESDTIEESTESQQEEPVDQIPETNEVEQVPQEVEDVQEEPAQEQLPQPESNEEIVNEPSVIEDNESSEAQGSEEVLGVTTSISYSTSKPSITLLEGVEYSKLERIIERSNLNDDSSSIKTIEELASEPESRYINTKITYQLSPDGINWYYYSLSRQDGIIGENRWALTTQEWTSSNSIQEVNQFLDQYESTFGSGILYLKIFLHSNSGSETPLLRELIIDRDTSLVSDVSLELPEEPKLETDTVNSLDWNTLEPVIFTASFYNGEKIVLGKVLSKEKSKVTDYEITEEELDNYKAVAYYAGTAQKIGESDLYFNSREEIEFLIRTAGEPGGYVVARIEPKVELEVESPIEESESNLVKLDNSPFSSAVENSTFTVDSTGDEVDASLNGICATAGGTCTLRAAIAEANNVGGSDNIFFNIPTSDTGYRDYDNPDTPSSGDSTGGDDYWSIRPASGLPQITGTTVLDGATQTTNQLNSNVNGPEIELNGLNTIATGLQLNAGSDNSEIRGTSIFRFSNNIISTTDAANTRYESNYIGTDIKASSISSPKTGGSGIVMTNSSGYVVNNIMGGIATAGVNLSCGSTQQNIVVTGNKIGLGLNSEALGIDDNGILIAGNCNVTIGGDNLSDRNYFGNWGLGGQDSAIFTQPTHVDQNLVIKNNYIGTDSTALVNAGGVAGVWINFETAGTMNGQLLIENNLFKYEVSYGIRNRAKTWNIIIRENSFSGSVAAMRNLNSSSPVDPTWFQNVSILNNYIGETPSDPYFGVALTGDFRYGIWGNSSSSTLQGNVIKTNSRAPIYFDHNSNPIIGGTDPLTGSLCEGLEKNCVSGGDWNEIYMVDSVPKNELTLYQDNSFPNVKDGANAIEQSWYGLFEVFSNNQRRTDLSNGTLNIPVPGSMLIKTTNNTETQLDIVSSMSNYNLTCTVASNCPVSNGVSGQTSILGPSTAVFSNEFTWFRITEYIVNENGVITEYSTSLNPTKPDLFHIAAASSFSFDGNSTTQVPSVDRGQPWTTNLTATRNISTGDFGRFQIMEVELVDANPIPGTDGSRVIVVDSTLDTNNVSTAQYDDGEGTASGGGTNGTNGRPDGKTTLREAITIANLLPSGTIKKIVFCIPNGLGGDTTGLDGLLDFDCGQGTVDANYNLVGFENRWRLNVSDLPDINNSNVQILADYTYDWISPESYPEPTAKPRIVIDHSTDRINITAGNNGFVMKGIKLTGPQNLYRILIGNGATGSIRTSSNIIGGDSALDRNVILNGSRNIFAISMDNSEISGNFIGVDDDGVTRQTNNSDLSVVITGSNNNTIGKVGLGRNIITGGVTGLNVATSSDNTVIKNNYIGVGYDGVTNLPNTTTGFSIDNSFNAIIGGDIETEGNIISGNSQDLATFHSTPQNSSHQIYGNILGLDKNGNPLTSSSFGVIFTRSNTIDFGHSTDINKRNIISGNSVGIVINRAGSNINLGINYIGYTKDGLTNRPNTTAISYTRDATNTDLDLSRSEISEQHDHIITLDSSLGLTVGNGNDLSFSDGYPKVKSLELPIDNKFGTENSFGVTENDAGDIDSGPNDIQNHPIITQVINKGGGYYEIFGELDGNITEASFEIDICQSYSNVNTPGFGGCEHYLGRITTAASPDEIEGSSNIFRWSLVVQTPDMKGTHDKLFSAIATNVNGSTSEFGPNFEAYISNSNYSITGYPVQLVYPIGGIEIEDKTPILDWNKSQSAGVINPEVDHYEVYLDGQYYGTQNSETTQQQILTDLSIGNHTWQVIAYRVNGEETGRSIVGSFEIVERSYGLILEYPVDITIDTTLPKFKWTSLKAVKTGENQEEIEVEVEYDLYINDELITENISDTNYQLTKEDELNFSESYTWKVIAREKGTDNELINARSQFNIEEIQTVTTADDSGEVEGDDFGGTWAVTLVTFSVITAFVIFLIIFLSKRRKKETTKDTDNSNPIASS